MWSQYTTTQAPFITGYISYLQLISYDILVNRHNSTPYFDFQLLQGVAEKLRAYTSWGQGQWGTGTAGVGDRDSRGVTGGGQGQWVTGAVGDRDSGGTVTVGDRDSGGLDCFVIKKVFCMSFQQKITAIQINEQYGATVLLEDTGGS